MHPRTVATLKDLESAPWFQSVGVRDTSNAQILGSWKEAIDSCSSTEWENLCQEIINSHRKKIQVSAPMELAKWNSIVADVKSVTRPFVRKAVAKTMEQNKLPKIFEDTVHWDILHLCMESEYADIVPVGFFAGQAFWYRKGHFPCGWSGDTTNGQPVIY